MIIAETVRALSWTMLFEIVCKSAHDPLQIFPEPSKSMIVAETWLTLSGTMLLGIICKSRRGPIQDHPNL